MLAKGVGWFIGHNRGRTKNHLKFWDLALCSGDLGCDLILNPNCLLGTNLGFSNPYILFCHLWDVFQGGWDRADLFVMCWALHSGTWLYAVEIWGHHKFGGLGSIMGCWKLATAGNDFLLFWLLYRLTGLLLVSDWMTGVNWSILDPGTYLLLTADLLLRCNPAGCCFCWLDIDMLLQSWMWVKNNMKMTVLLNIFVLMICCISLCYIVLKTPLWAAAVRILIWLQTRVQAFLEVCNWVNWGTGWGVSGWAHFWSLWRPKGTYWIKDNTIEHGKATGDNQRITWAVKVMMDRKPGIMEGLIMGQVPLIGSTLGLVVVRDRLI